MNTLLRVIGISLPLLLIGCASMPAVGEEESTDARQVRLWHAFYKQRAQEFAVEEIRDKPVSLSLVREPIQTWTNPIRGDTQHGTVHLWTNAGRPRVIGSVWSALDPKDRSKRNLCYEFHSLSEVPLSVSLDGKSWWSPKEPGIEWLPLTDVPSPAPSRSARLRQMRGIIRELHGEIVSRESELRLLPQPLYRYPEDTRGVLDGANFAFVMATDPEIFVVLEARKGENAGEASWSLAPVRFTGAGIRLKRGDKTLWESPEWEYRRDRIYDFLYGVEQHSVDPPNDDGRGKRKGRD